MAGRQSFDRDGHRFALTPATEADFERVHDLRLAAMRPSLEAVGRFDPERSRRRLAAHFAPEHT